MIELGSGIRQRSRANSYTKLEQEDDLDKIPPLYNYVEQATKKVPRKHNKTCAKICFFFSLSGMIFLGSISAMLHHDSPYLIVSPENMNRKPELADGMTGAVMMYFGCMLISAYLWGMPVGVEEEGPGLETQHLVD